MIATKVPASLRINWAVQKAKLKTRFPKLTDDDLNFSEALKNEMFNKLELKLGITSKELQVIIETL